MGFAGYFLFDMLFTLFLTFVFVLLGFVAYMYFWFYLLLALLLTFALVLLGFVGYF